MKIIMIMIVIMMIIPLLFVPGESGRVAHEARHWHQAVSHPQRLPLCERIHPAEDQLLQAPPGGVRRQTDPPSRRDGRRPLRPWAGVLRRSIEVIETLSCGENLSFLFVWYTMPNNVDHQQNFFNPCPAELLNVTFWPTALFLVLGEKLTFGVFRGTT